MACAFDLVSLADPNVSLRRLRSLRPLLSSSSCLYKMRFEDTYKRVWMGSRRSCEMLVWSFRTACELLAEFEGLVKGGRGTLVMTPRYGFVTR